MKRCKLSLASLAELDLGKVDGAFKAQLRHILADLVDRPEEKKERTIILKMSVAPEEVSRGVLDSVRVWFQLGSKVPGLRSKDYSMLASDKDISFNADSLDDAKQLTFESPEGQEPG